MPVVRDMYVEKGTFIHKLDPRTKLISVILGMIAAAILKGALQLFIYFCVLLIILALSKIGWRSFLWGVKTIAPVSILIFALSPISFPVEPVIGQVGPFKISIQSFLIGAEFVLRIAVMAFSVYLLLFTTSQRDLALGLVKLGLPYRYGLMLTMALRYIPTFGAIAGMVTDAQKARALELEKGNFLKKTKRYTAVLAPIIISALRMADQLSIAIASRGFGACEKQTVLRDLRMAKADIIALIFVIGVFIAIIIGVILV